MGPKLRLSHFLSYLLVSILLAIFLFSARSGIYYNRLFFWIFVIYLLSFNIFFIYTYNGNNIVKRTMLFSQMILFLIVIRIPYRTTFGLYGVDSPTEFLVTEHIMKYGWVISDNLLPTSYYNQSNYPLLYIINIIFSKISGESILFVENWFPVALTLVVPFFIYLTSYELFKSEKSALLASYSFSTLYGYMIFYSLTLRESIGFIFFIQIIYLILKLDGHRKQNKIKNTILILLYVFALILSHHLTSFMLLLFMFICVFIAYLLKIAQGKYFKHNFRNNYSMQTNLLLITLVLFISYWIYAYASTPSRSPFTMLVNTFIQIIRIEVVGHSTDIVNHYPDIMRYKILLTGAIVFGFIFAFFSALTLLFRRNNLIIYELIYFIAGLIPGVFGLLTALKLFGVNINAERFMTFGYFYLLILSSYAAVKLLSYRYIKYGILIIYLSFAIFNVFIIHPYLYTADEPDYMNGEVRSYSYYTEYIPLNWFNVHSLDSILIHEETARILTPFIAHIKYKQFIGAIDSQIKNENDVYYISLPKKSIPYLSHDDVIYVNSNASKIYNNRDSIILMI